MENDTTNDKLLTRSFSSTTIWVGGTSALAETYIEEILGFPKVRNSDKTRLNRRFFLASPDALLHRERNPSVSQTTDSYICCTYLPLDMTKRDSIDRFFDRFLGDKNHLANHTNANPTVRVTIIFGMRSSLVKGSSEEHHSLTEHLSYFLHQASRRFSSNGRISLVGVLNVSSVAVMDHTSIQSMLSEDAPLPTKNSYASPYDATKRQTEEILASACRELCIPSCVHLRISGIFSNEVPPSSCIQMSVIRFQAHLGSCLQTPLDMNTSYNVCQAIKLILDRMDEIYHQNSNCNGNSEVVVSGDTSSISANDKSGLGRVYFYTRPTIDPRPYGDNLVAYRSAHNIVYSVNVPDWFTRIFIWAFIYLFRGIASAGSVLLGDKGKRRYTWLASLCDVLGNASYLLTVSMVEHTFDNSRIRKDFPELNSLEESILEGFVRIRKRKVQRNATVNEVEQ